jgi:hypothetical protein
MLQERRSTLSNEDGTFRFDSLERGVYNLFAFDLDTSRGFARMNVALTSDTLHSIGQCPVDKLGGIRGNVVSGQNQSMDSLWVYMKGSDFVAHTGQSGAFALEGVPAGEYCISAAYDAPKAGADQLYFDAQVLDVAPGDTAVATILAQDTTASDSLFSIELGGAPGECRRIDEWKMDAAGACGQKGALFENIVYGKSCGQDSCSGATAVCSDTTQ